MAADANSNEIWKDIPGYEGRYEVSSHGRVRTSKGLILKRRVLWTGYDRASLTKDRKVRHFAVHRLVCAAFIGPIPEGKEVNHIDGVRLNNRIENLEYVTRLQNLLHKRVTGTDGRGETNPNARLSAREVIEIRRLRAGGTPRKSLAAMYGVTVHMISKITARKNWTHI